MELNPSYGDAFYFRGMFYYLNNETDKAINDLNAAIKFGSKESKIYYYRAMAQLSNVNYEDAIKDFNLAIQEDPKDVDAFTERGWINVKWEHYSEAVKDFSEAIELEPQKERPYRGRALARKSLGDLNGAERDTKKANELKPKIEEESETEIQKRTPIPEKVRHAVWRRDQGMCVRCGSRENLEYDHIIPLSLGGSNTERNIELLCEKCNRSKGDKIQ
jgi:tetratricopeptide (TPR) repeat protein